MGFLGSEWELIRDLVETSEPHYLKQKFGLYVLPTEYDPNISKYFRGVYDYFQQCSEPSDHPKLDRYIPSCPSGYFELTDVDWFSKEEILDMLSSPGSGGIKKVSQQVFRAFWSVQEDELGFTKHGRQLRTNSS